MPNNYDAAPGATEVARVNDLAVRDRVHGVTIVSEVFAVPVFTKMPGTISIDVGRAIRTPFSRTWRVALVLRVDIPTVMGVDLTLTDGLGLLVA
jgi:hypothetical protein